MEHKLKNCPFCGYQPTLKDFVTRRFFADPVVSYYVQCNCCGGRTLLCEDAIVAVEKWNRRVDHD